MSKGKLIVNLPSTPKDTEVEVFPYGMFANGYAYEVEDLKDGEGNLVEELVVGDVKAKPPVVDEPNPVPPTVSQELPDFENTTQAPPVKSDDTGAESTDDQTNTGGDE